MPRRQHHVPILGVWCLVLVGGVFWLGAVTVRSGYVPAMAIPLAGPFVPLILGTAFSWCVALAAVIVLCGGCVALARKRTVPRLMVAMIGTGAWIAIGIVQLYRWL